MIYFKLISFNSKNGRKNELTQAERRGVVPGPQELWAEGTELG